MKVKFICKYENKEDGLKAYEFETPESIYIESGDCYIERFRLDFLKGESMIMETISDAPYMVCEDVTHLFNLDDIIKQMQEIESEIDDEQEQYNEWWEEEGMFE